MLGMIQPPTLLLGDCLALLPALQANAVDMVFADLPYGVTANKWDSVITFAPLWEQLLRVGKKNCAFVFTATQPFATALICSQPNLFIQELIWDKTRGTDFPNANVRPLNRHENIMVFSRATANPMSKLRVSYNPQKTAGNTYVSKRGSKTDNYGTGLDAVEREQTGRFPTSIIEFKRDKNKVHPAQKPVALLEWLIKTYTNPGDTVLDPTTGSGTPGVACANTGRCFVGIEQDTTYFETATRRVAEASRG